MRNPGKLCLDATSTMLFVQPFGLLGDGGGPQIIRTLCELSPLRTVHVATTPHPVSEALGERHFPIRPLAGRLERTRVGPVFQALDTPFVGHLRRRLVALGRREEVRAVHVVAHGSEFVAALGAARALDVPFFISVHDDLAWTLGSRPDRALVLRSLGHAWRHAAHRFVISEEIGSEYSRRYDDRAFTLVSDGLREVPSAPRPKRPGPLRLYFMGSFHWSYRANVRALSRALRDHDPKASIVFRGGGPPEQDLFGVEHDVRPFARGPDLETDLTEVDAVYLPLPFDAKHRNFVRLSLSTKMISYLGSGRPILYHGPADAAAARLLGRANAGALATDLEDVGPAVRALVSDSDGLARRALALGDEQFRVERIRERFWAHIKTAPADTQAAPKER